MNTRRNTLLLGFAAVLLAAGIAFGLVLSGDSASGDSPEPQTLDVDGFELTYPGEWQEVISAEFPLAEALNADQVGEHVVGIDSDNYVVAYTFENPADRLPTHDELVQFGVNTLGPVFRETVEATPGARLIGAPIATEVAGQPALAVLAEIEGEDGAISSYEMDMVFYEGRPGVIVAYTATPERAAEMRLAFADMIETLTPPES